MPYQRRWLADKSRFKIALKARQIGFSFVIALEGVLDALSLKQKIIFLSASQRQSQELLEKVYSHLRVFTLLAGEDSLVENSSMNRSELLLPNGSVILSLPANPKTIRGFTGSIFLDEFAFHQNADEIYKAIMPTVTRGKNRLRIVSTPAGDQGMFYRLWTGNNPYSKHRVDLDQAVRDGLKINREKLREAVPDQEIFAQEFECRFLSSAGSFIPEKLIQGCLETEGNSFPSGGDCYVGVDIGRYRDLSVFYVVEEAGEIFFTREIVVLQNKPFEFQKQTIRELLACYSPRRTAVDSGGIGLQLAEELEREFPDIVEKVTFTVSVKEAIAVNLKRCFESRSVRIPADRELINDIRSLKRQVTASGKLLYNAERSAKLGHADRFWALGLALYAAGKRGEMPAQEVSLTSDMKWYQAERKRLWG
ncbi:MAG: terminase large subunit domain-containing protein [bacterium]